jgi:hypothetical protein
MFALNLLKERAADRLETHAYRCGLCSTAVERTKRDHNLIRAELRQHGLSAHNEGGRTISLWVVSSGQRWSFRVIGFDVSLGGTALDKPTAIRKALVAFATAFPAHDCSNCKLSDQHMEATSVV